MLSRRRQPWELAAVLLVVVAVSVAGVDAWSVGATLEEVPAGSLVSLPFELPAFINNSLTLTLDQSPAEEGVFLFSVCLNRNANAAPPFDASGEFSLDNWSTCFAQYPSITTASVVRNITFVPTGMVFVSIYVNTAPANFSIALTLSGDQCDDGFSPDCTVPASLPLANVTLDPGQQLLFSIPPVPALSRYVQLWLTFGNTTTMPWIVISNANAPSASSAWYQIQPPSTAVQAAYPRSCSSNECLYFGGLWAPSNATGSVELLTVEAKFPAISPVPAITIVGASSNYSAVLSMSDLANMRFYQLSNSSRSFSIGAMAWPRDTMQAVPSILAMAGALPYWTAKYDVALLGARSVPNATLFYSTEYLQTTATWYAGLNATVLAPSDATFVLWFNAACPSNCSGHGVCDETTHLCACDMGFIGPACTPPPPPGPPTPPPPPPAGPPPPPGPPPPSPPPSNDRTTKEWIIIGVIAGVCLVVFLILVVGTVVVVLRFVRSRQVTYDVIR